MLYALIKIPAKIALRLYCRNIKINKTDLLKSEGPLLIACNHPNSFLDAVIIATLFKRPVYSLARGDVFVNKFYSKLLLSLNILPVYRQSEGAENLGTNYKTFDQCKEIFKKNGIVLIFSEGMCINEWHLRPLKKGTARLAITSWEHGIPLKILPVGINYSSFKKFGKNIQLDFGEMISPMFEDIGGRAMNYGSKINFFNAALKTQLKQVVLEINKNDKPTILEKFSIPVSLIKKIILFIPALIGWLIHAPIYYPLKNFTWKRTAHNDHFDSVLIGSLLILEPFYLLLICLIIYWLAGGWWWVATLILFPFCAWSYVQLKQQFEE